MKKLLRVLLTLFSLFIATTVDAQVVPVYMITKEGCPACEKALDYFATLNKQNPDLFELYNIEIFNSKWQFKSNELKLLFQKVYEYFGEDSNRAATPTIVIGDYHIAGFPKDTSVFINKINEAKDNNSEDVFKKISTELNINLDEIRIIKSNKNEELIVVIVSALIVVAIIGFIIVGSKQKNH